VSSFLTAHQQTRRTKTADVTKDYITSQHSDILMMCCTSRPNIFGDICCFTFSSASLLMSSLKCVLNC